MKFNWKNVLKSALVVFLLYLAVFYWKNVSELLGNFIGACIPLTVGLIIAYLINILMTLYEKIYFPKKTSALVVKTRRPVCLTLAFLTMAAIIALISILIIPQLAFCVELLIKKIPDAFSSFVKWADNRQFMPEYVIQFISGIDWKSRIDEIVNLVTSGVGGVMDTVLKTVTSVVSGVVAAFIGIIFSIYLLFNKERLQRQIVSVLGTYLPEKIYLKVRYFFTVLNESFKNFIVGQCLEAVILGALCTVGMTILRLPYAPAIGALIAFTSLIPIAGSYFGAIVGAFLLLTSSPAQSLIFLIFLILLQQFEGNVIYPKVVGSSLGLPGIWVLAAITIGGGLMGVGGMLVFVPLTAAIYKIIRDDVAKKRELK